MANLAFLPDAQRASQLNKVMKQRLADSLKYIAQQSAGQIDFPKERFDQMQQRLRDGDIVSPATFALYYDLIIAIEQDDLERARQIATQFSIHDEDTPEFGVRSFSTEELGPEKYEIYQQFADCDPESPLNLIPASPGDYQKMKSLVEEAMSLIDSASPQLASEIRELLCEIVIATNQSDAEHDFIYSGVSSAYLWGAVFLNINTGPVLRVAESIIHESAHMLLFALSMDGDMSRDPYDQRLASPLREDLRPMEGVYHATFVLGRMYYGIKAMLESGVLNEEQSREAEHLIQESSQNFKEGLTTVEEAASLTETGMLVMAETKRYMQEHSAL